MPKPAVSLFYVSEQNSPSKPDAKVLLLPDDVAERKEHLLKEFSECFGDEGATPTVSEIPTEYADITLSHEDTYVFITYVELPAS